MQISKRTSLESHFYNCVNILLETSISERRHVLCKVHHHLKNLIELFTRNNAIHPRRSNS